LANDGGNFTNGLKISSNRGFEITNGGSESTNGDGKTTNGEVKLTVSVINFTNEGIKTTNRWAKRTNRGVKLTNDVKISSNGGFETAKCTILAAAAFELDGEWVGKFPATFATECENCAWSCRHLSR
jgi:hypothetical protein